MNPETAQVINDYKTATIHLLEKVQDIIDDNNQNPFDIADAELCFNEVKEAFTELEKQFSQCKEWCNHSEEWCQ